MFIDTATPHVMDEDQLYEHFRAGNWWSKSWLFPALFVGLCMVGFASFVFKANWDTKAEMYSLLWFTVAALVIPLVMLAVIKYFAHDRPWQKYQEYWNIGRRV